MAAGAFGSSMHMTLATAEDCPRDQILANSCMWALPIFSWINLRDLGSSFLVGTVKTFEIFSLTYSYALLLNIGLCAGFFSC